MSSAAYCFSQNKPCIQWIEKYFKDCLCNLSDEISFSLGIASLICWGVAEIPQIISNFVNKSSHGVSLLFLLTWIAGDVFNLVGCFLEPATLPTQLYTALLYTISTVVLVLQTIYYDYIYKWLNCRNNQGDSKVEDVTKPLNPKPQDPTTPISSAPLRVSQRKSLYFTSARSLASSGTPPYGSYLRPAARSGPATLEDVNSSSSDEEGETYEASPKKSSSQPRRIPRSVGYGTFLGTSASLFFQSKALIQGQMGVSGRRLLLESEMEHSALGVCLGWMMAAIYMGGRIPQICLNIKRGSVEGLNPLMFIFALIANVTYVGSILVRSSEWETIKPNMPWLLDAIVCVALDLFIILQFIYYKFMQKKAVDESQGYGDYKDAEKQVVR